MTDDGSRLWLGRFTPKNDAVRDLHTHAWSGLYMPITEQSGSSPEQMHSRSGSSHTVQLFDEISSVAATVSAFVSAGLAAGAPVIVAARRSYWAAIAQALMLRGEDPIDRIATHDLIVLDAATALSGFMRRGTPDPDLFASQVGLVVRTTADRSSAGLWIYGEMVDVLADQQEIRAAQELERLWNTLLAEIPCQLLCGYTSGNFASPRHRNALAAICRAHTHVAHTDGDLLSAFLLNQSLAPEPRN
jgi:hypothetical protein